MGQPHLFLYIFVLFKQKFYRKIVDVSGIWTWIMGVEGEHADHLTTTTTPERLFLKTEIPMFCLFLKCPSLAWTQIVQYIRGIFWKLSVYYDAMYRPHHWDLDLLNLFPSEIGDLHRQSLLRSRAKHFKCHFVKEVTTYNNEWMRSIGSDPKKENLKHKISYDLAA